MPERLDQVSSTFRLDIPYIPFQTSILRIRVRQTDSPEGDSLVTERDQCVAKYNMAATIRTSLTTYTPTTYNKLSISSTPTGLLPLVLLSSIVLNL